MAVANPYAPPAAALEDVSPNAQAEAIRRAHINHEASIKAVGFLYYLGGVALTIGGLASIASGTPTWIFLLAAGVAQLFAGYGVRALKKWGWVLGLVISGLGLLAFPIGTLINAYILYLFVAKKGRTIFTPEYREVIAATPDVRYKTSIIVWILLALMAGFILFAVAVPFFNR